MVSSKCRNEPSGSIKCGEVLEDLSGSKERICNMQLVTLIYISLAGIAPVLVEARNKCK